MVVYFIPGLVFQEVQAAHPIPPSGSALRGDDGTPSESYFAARGSRVPLADSRFGLRAHIHRAAVRLLPHRDPTAVRPQLRSLAEPAKEASHAVPGHRQAAPRG